MKLTFLGDVHGDWNVLNKILQKHKNKTIVQVGDLGLGFESQYVLNINSGLWEASVNNDPKTFPENFRFIRGNHCNPEVSRIYPNYLGDFGYNKELGIFYVSGAWSIDRENRTQGIDWWPEEELSIEQLNQAIDLYKEIRPEIIVSHTCPEFVANQLINRSHKRYTDQRTEIALDRMFQIHKPKYWIFGHWHVVWRKNIDETNFVCCPINGTFTLDI